MATTTERRFEIEPSEYGAEKPPRSKWMSCLIGCLIVFGVMFVIALALGIWLSFHWRGFVSNAASDALNQAVEQSDLPQQEKQEVKDQVERVTSAFAAKQITFEQVGKIMEGIVKSPLMPSLVVVAVDKQYFDKSGLSAEEKDEGRKTLQRFARGLVDKKIDEKGMDAVLSHIADRKGDEWELRQHVSDDDLRAALKEAKTLADDAKIPDEPEKFDPSDEIKKIIDDAMKQP